MYLLLLVARTLGRSELVRCQRALFFHCKFYYCFQHTYIVWSHWMWCISESAAAGSRRQSSKDNSVPSNLPLTTFGESCLCLCWRGHTHTHHTHTHTPQNEMDAFGILTFNILFTQVFSLSLSLSTFNALLFQCLCLACSVGLICAICILRWIVSYRIASYWQRHVTY